VDPLLDIPSTLILLLFLFLFSILYTLVSLLLESINTKFIKVSRVHKYLYGSVSEGDSDSEGDGKGDDEGGYEYIRLRE